MAENELPETPVDDQPSESGGEPSPSAEASLAPQASQGPDESSATGPQAQSASPAEDEPAGEESAAGNEPENEPAPEKPPVAKKQSASKAPAPPPAAEEAAEDEPEAEAIPKEWYILKVQVNRENSIRDALQRRVKVEGLEKYFGDIIVPTEDVAEFDKNGKKRIVKRKLYPGYLVANMAITEETWFVVRETPGIGDFTGAAGKPSPMAPHEVQRILAVSRPDEGAAAAKTAIPFKVGDKVRVKEGYFQNFEGDVDSIDEANGRVTVMINIFGRSTPVELEHWQVEEV